MPVKKGKVRKEVHLTKKQKELLDQMVDGSQKTASNVMGQLIEVYFESYKRKFCVENPHA